MIEAKLRIFKADGLVVGFSIIAEPQTEAQTFCDEMPRALRAGTGKAAANGTRVTFTCPSEGDCHFEVPKEDADMLGRLFTEQEPYSNIKLKLERIRNWTSGFKYIIDGQEKSGVEYGPYQSLP